MTEKLNFDRAISLSRLASDKTPGNENERAAAAGALAKLIEKEPGIIVELANQLEELRKRNDFEEAVKPKRRRRPSPKPSQPEPPFYEKTYEPPFTKTGDFVSSVASFINGFTRVHTYKTPFKSQTRVREVKKG